MLPYASLFSDIHFSYRETNLRKKSSLIGFPLFFYIFGTPGEMAKAVISVIILGVFSGLSSGTGVLPDVVAGAVGTNLTFETELSPTDEPFLSITWWFGDLRIINSDSSNVTHSQYENRITLFPTTGSLQLRNLLSADSGEYRVAIIPNGGRAMYGSTRLQVYVPVSNVIVVSSNTDLLELRDFVRLSCSASGTSIFMTWYNDTSEVIASDRVQITDGASTLTITNVTRYDQGPFSCVVSNAAGSVRSDLVNLTVNYGPESTNIKLSPPQEYFEEGSDIILSCSADSRPEASFEWFFNGERLNTTESELTLTEVTLNQTGNYSCLAYNERTFASLMSQTSVISLLEIISDASITSTTDVAIEGNTANLTCDAAGSIFTRTWSKDGSLIVTLADNVKFYDNNKVLAFQPLTKSDSGEYSCEISNPVSSETATHSMVVNYGPEDVQVEGPQMIDLNLPFTLNCSAESIPPASFTWILNETEIGHTSIYTKNISTPSDEGNYTCLARNTITGRMSSETHPLAVTEENKDPGTKGLSGGIIAAIVVAACVIVAVLTVAGYCLYKKKPSRKPKPRQQSTKRTAQVELPTVQPNHYDEVEFDPEIDPVYEDPDAIRNDSQNDTLRNE